MDLDTLAQAWIGTFGVAAIFMVNCPYPLLRKIAPIIGFMAGPAWYYTTWVNEQWAIFAMSFVYSYSWAMGVYVQWFKRPVRAASRSAP